MTLAWSRGKSMPSPATRRRMVSWVTAVTWTGAGASASLSSFLEQPDMATRQEVSMKIVIFRIG